MQLSSKSYQLKCLLWILVHIICLDLGALSDLTMLAHLFEQTPQRVKQLLSCCLVPVFFVTTH